MRSRTLTRLGAVLAVASAGTTAWASAASAAPTALAPPALTVTTVVSGLDRPWDVAFTPDGAMLYTQRPGAIAVRLPDGTVRGLTADLRDLWVSGETGLMSIEVDPAFVSNRRVYTCQGTTRSNFTVQVVAWVADAGLTRLDRVNDPLVGGIDGSSGRHGGCQLRFDQAGRLIVGTGDAATGTNPQNLASLAGKTLRVDRFTGAGIAGNAAGGDARIYTFGHRNVQGLALASDGSIYSVEHGTDRDDEINLLSAGGNYGWDPVPGYDESRPMTDLTKFPNAVRAVWSSGFPTVAPSGATFLRGSVWGEYEGALAVSMLKEQELRVLRISGSTVIGTSIPPELNGTFGRLRGAELGPDGALYLTTDNGGGGDRILRVAPTIVAPASRFVAGTPSRLVDTRTGAPIAAGTSRDFQITGGLVPSEATAVVLNVTATEAGGGGWLQVLPTGRATIGASSTLNLDFGGQTIPSSTFAPIGDGGKVTVFTTFTTDVVLDVLGYFVPAAAATAGRLVPLAPTRILDTRTPGPAPRRVLDGEVITLPVAGRGGVPTSGVSAVVMNVTAVDPTAPGFVQAAPTPVNRGAFSNLNPEPGRTTANLAVIPLGSAGTVDLFTELYVPGAIDLLADVVGYFTDGSAPSSTAGRFVPIPPSRQLDTRLPAPQPERPSGSITEIDVSDVAPGAAAIAGTLTSVGGGANGYLQLGAKPLTPGSTSSLNTSYENQTIANAVVSAVGPGVLLQVFTVGSTHELLDVTGWFTGTG